MANSRTQTVYIPNLFDRDTANKLYKYLKNNIEWSDGILSKRANRITRKAYMADSSDTDINNFISDLVLTALNEIDTILFWDLM